MEKECGCVGLVICCAPHALSGLDKVQQLDGFLAKETKLPRRGRLPPFSWP